MKKTLVLAACAIAGVLTASAQSNVYSLNIVGYVNTVFKGGGAYTLCANPLDAPTNDAISMLPLNTLNNGSRVMTWNGAGYDVMLKSFGAWSPTNVNLPVGKGFFVRNNLTTNYTVTFVGNVLGGVPGTNTTDIVPGYQLYGSKAPIGGDVFATGNNTLNMGGILAALPNGSRVMTWDNSGSGAYSIALKSFGAWSPTNKLINVGEGFFIRNNSLTTNTWQVILQ
jgi:hypothetical protein